MDSFHSGLMMGTSASATTGILVGQPFAEGHCPDHSGMFSGTPDLSSCQQNTRAPTIRMEQPKFLDMVQCGGGAGKEYHEEPLFR